MRTSKSKLLRMPSVTDIQQPSSNIHGKSTPPPPATTSTDTNNADPIGQALSLLEKKQRNLGKRKERLEKYDQEAKSGKDLHKDQIDALAKYPEVIGQIECVKELIEQLKKILTESSKNQKRLSKQAADEKRLFTSQRLREYAQIRYLLDHRPTSLKPEESTLLDELSSVIIPIDNSPNSISRSVDTVLSIYQSNSSSTTVRNLPGRNVQEVRETLEQLIKNLDVEKFSSITPPEPEQIKESEETNKTESTTNDNNQLNDYPIQFDTRKQNVSYEQILQDNTFFSNDSNNPTQDDQSTDPKQFLPTLTVVNSNIHDQQSQDVNNREDSNNQQQSDEQSHHQRGNENTQRGGQFHNGGGNRPYHRGRSNNYNQQRRGPHDGRYDNGYGQRSYYENTQGRGGSNANYRGNNRGGNYRFANRGYNNNNGNGYQNSAQYQQSNNQYQQPRSAPPAAQQQ